MSEKVTREQLDRMAETINRMLKGTGNKIVIGGRYGYTAVDLGYEDKPYGLQDTLRSGMTKKETLEYMWALKKGMELAEKKIGKVI
jgi:hypothetical protein